MGHVHLTLNSLHQLTHSVTQLHVCCSLHIELKAACLNTGTEDRRAMGLGCPGHFYVCVWYWGLNLA
jgi:hypothetical protein